MLSILCSSKKNDEGVGEGGGEGVGNDDEEVVISDVCHDPFINGLGQEDPSSPSSSSPPHPLSEDWAVLSISGNTFLKGQPRRMIGLVLAVMWGWLPISFIEASLSSENIIHLPSCVPGCGLYLSECRYDKWEAKSDMRFDPRRFQQQQQQDATALTRLNSWIRIVQAHAVKSMRRRGYDWMKTMQAQCERSLQNYEMERNLRLRSLADLRRSIEPMEEGSREEEEQEGRGSRYGIPTTLAGEIYAAYENVLRLLREADRSGQWPSSSQARQKIIFNENETSPSLSPSSSPTGGTFSVGFLPPPLVQPRGNELFPELLIACFRLEQILCPSRKPSSTIAINRHAQFLPHRDSGAGTGQDRSLIVGLGNYSGGEIMIETCPHDIRYQPIEFNGWLDRHWTLPFQGERYSLVWFTPIGVRIPDDLWWLDQL